MSDASSSHAPERPLWFERVFTLDLPAWMLANVIERLRGTPARLEERLRDVSPAVLTRRDGERWSIQENAGHLLDLEELWLGRVDDFAEGRERLRAADLTNRRTHEAAHNARAVEGILAEFRAARARLVARLEALSAAEQERTALHPRLTFAADILGRTLRDLGRLVPTRRQFPFVTQSGEFGTATFEEFTRRPGDLNLLVGVAGIRYNPRGNLLISAQMLVPVTEAGLRDKITPVIGIDYSF